jgi:pimeloyl-ACP methyl ester carboxylesterase
LNPLDTILRKARRQLSYLKGYLDFDPLGNEVTRRTDFSQCQKPVLLLYGFLSTRRTFEVLERRLRRDGYCVFSIKLGGILQTFNSRGIDDIADFIRAKVERLYARHEGMGPLAIIGHSKGGLIGRYYIKRLGGERRCRALITLGAPHNGTPMAYAGIPIGMLARSLWQMTPMSPFIRRLKEGPWPSHVRFSSIYSKTDRMTPFPAALLETGGLPHLNNVEVGNCAHREYLVKKKVYDAILSELKAAEAAAPTSTSPLKLVPGSGG